VLTNATNPVLTAVIKATSAISDIVNLLVTILGLYNIHRRLPRMESRALENLP